MRKIKSALITLPVIIVLGGFCLGSKTPLWAQDGDAKPPSIHEQKMTEQQSRGEMWFVQRCSICHLGRIMKEGQTPATVGPSLVGVFKNASADTEKSLRAFVMKGTPSMPGFQYALTQKQLDDLISYLKTM